MTTCTFNFQSSRSLDRIEKIRSALLKGPQSKFDLVKILGVSDATVHDFMQHLHKDRIHIAGWRRCTNHYAALWLWGAGQDAPLPPWVKKPEPPRAPRIRTPKQMAVRKTWIERSKPPKAAPAPVVRSFRPQPVARDWSVEAMFGPAYVGLNAELAGMRS